MLAAYRSIITRGRDALAVMDATEAGKTPSSLVSRWGGVARQRWLARAFIRKRVFKGRHFLGRHRSRQFGPPPILPSGENKSLFSGGTKQEQ